MSQTEEKEENSSGAGFEPAPGAADGPLHEVSPAELLAVPPRVRPQREGGRIPEDMEETQRLQEEAQEPVPTDTEVPATVDTTPDEEGVDADEALAVFNAPEAGSLAGVDLDAVVEAAPVTRVFEGNRYTGLIPPDHAIAVGPNHFLVAVNAELQMFNKQTGAPATLPWALSDLFSAAMPPGNVVLFDPRVAYDHYAQRWIVVAVAARANPAGSWIMVGRSDSSDPLGIWRGRALDATLDGSTPTNNWASYPMLGFDTQAIYISSNMRAFPFSSGTFQYAKLRILSKADVYGLNLLVPWWDFPDLRNPDNSVARTVQPATHFHDAGAGANPDAYLVNAIFPGGNTLTLWTLRDPIGFRATPARVPSLTRVSVPCLSYSQPPPARQPGTTVRLGGSDYDTRLQNAVYQELSFVGRRLWTCQTSAHTWGGDTEARSVVQWYEIDVPSQTVLQQARYGASGRYYFFPAIQTDAFGNAYLVFGSSSANGVSRRADLRQTGRQRTDETDLLQPSTRVKGGEASFTQGGGRWGDYNAMARDGGEPRIVWGYGSFANHGNQWGTRVFSTNFSGLP